MIGKHGLRCIAPKAQKPATIPLTPALSRREGDYGPIANRCVPVEMYKTPPATTGEL